MTKQAAQEKLRRLVESNRHEIIEGATDWVIEQSDDLQGQRPREETRAIVVRMVAGQEAALLHDDFEPLDKFVDFVTSFRANSEFHPSTILRGTLSFRQAIQRLAVRETIAPALMLELIEAIDAVYFQAVFRIADRYAEKLNHTVVERRQELEKVVGARERELEAKIATIRDQQVMLSRLSSPVIQVWDKVLLIPIVGEITSERASEVKRKLLNAIDESDCEALLIDITGLTVVDEQAGAVLLKMIRAARLLGAEGMLVGMSADVAKSLMDLDIDLEETETFATLQSGLTEAIRRLRERRAPARLGVELSGFRPQRADAP